jgi:hypothetical protein
MYDTYLGGKDSVNVGRILDLTRISFAPAQRGLEKGSRCYPEAVGSVSR